MKKNICTCGHSFKAHEHFRKGTDCGLCPQDTACLRYTPQKRLPLPTEVSIEQAAAVAQTPGAHLRVTEVNPDGLPYL